MENQQQTAPVLTLKDWLITYLISAIPIAGFVMLFVWAFGANENPNKSNWAKAVLIFMLIAFILVVALWGTIAAIVFSSMSGSNDF